MRHAQRQKPESAAKRTPPEPLIDQEPAEKRPFRLLSGMSGIELTGYAEWLIASLGISGRKKLYDVDRGMYQTLRNRELLDDVGLPNSNEKHRRWATMGDEELLAYARNFIAEKGIRNRKGLQKADGGLYQVLLKRGLLNSAFSDAESSRHSDAVDGVLEALDSFGDSK